MEAERAAKRQKVEKQLEERERLERSCRSNGIGAVGRLKLVLCMSVAGALFAKRP